jgi:integrase/recombinase XerD
MLTTDKTAADLARATASWLAQFASKTQGTYASFLSQWEAFLTGRNRAVPGASRDDVQDWVGYLQAAGRAPGTIAGAVSTLSSLYRYLIEDEVIDCSPVVRIRRPKVSPISTRKAPDRVELARLLELAQLDGPRQHLLVCLLGLNGLRVSEALQVKRSALRVDRSRTLLFIIGKGQRPAFVPLAARTIAALDRVVAMTDAGAEELLLPWSSYAANRTVQSLAKRAGITKHTSPHSLRHSFVTLGLAAGVPLDRMQAAARHSNPATTVRYSRNMHDIDGHGAYTVADYLAG